MLIVNTPVETRLPIPVPVPGGDTLTFWLDVWHYVPIPVPMPAGVPDVTINLPLPAPVLEPYGVSPHALAQQHVELTGVHHYGHVEF